jgi:DNA invertase Pin-like site-specific DNA recombinase
MNSNAESIANVNLSSSVTRPSKLRERHLNRLAIVYVRQSSPNQVLENRESRERQYALAEFAKQLGWPAERVLVIDEDQGLSGRSSENRQGFQRLLAEVSLNHVGLVLGLELSRLSRSSKDWHHLVDVCSIFNTLLGDQDGLYDASDGNDRLLLGMKGAMSEFELVTLRNRLERGRDNKAARGELVMSVPIGYLKLPSGEVVIEPDEQARGAVATVFDKFRELGTAWKAFRYLRDNGIQMGYRCQRGSARGELQWRRPTIRCVLRILRHPIYAGAYAYGMRGKGHQHPGDRKGSTAFLPPDQMRVLIPGRFPAYIGSEEFTRNQEQLQQNRSLKASRGIARSGKALLAGLACCGSCGRRYRVAYRTHEMPHYTCESHLVEGKEQQTCWGLRANELDELVAQQVLIALSPAGIDLSIKASQDIDKERKRLHKNWQQRLERSRQEVQRAERQYQAVEPENRLVARTLESRWEQALRYDQELREEYARFSKSTPARLSIGETEQIRRVAADIDALWRSKAASHADKKEVVRCLVDRVVVHVQSRSEYVDVTIYWHGGFSSQHEIARPVFDVTQQRDYDRFVSRIHELHAEGLNCSEMAARLNDEGFVPARRRGGYSKSSLHPILVKLGIARSPNHLDPHEWWACDLAKELGVTNQKLYHWARQGYVHARRTPQRHWIIWADSDELQRLHKLKEQTTSWIKKRAPELTVPKHREQAG